MNNDDWIKKLSERLEDHTAEPPKDLWHGIEAKLHKQQQRKRVLWIRRYAAAAVLLVAVVMATVYYLRRDGDITMRQPLNETVFTASTQDKNQQTIKQLVEEKIKTIVTSSYTDRKLIAYVQKNNSNTNGFQKVSFDDAKEPISQSQRAYLDSPKDTFEKPKEAKSESRSQSTQYKKSSDLSAGEAWTTSKNTRSRQQQWSVGAHTTGVFANDNSLNGVLLANEPVIMAAKPSNDYLMAARVNETRYEKKEHHQPIQVGLTASYALSDRVAITSGVVYTRTTSDFIRVTGRSEMVDKQTLHYVGVPVNVNYNVWQTQRFKAYVTAGGEADFNVKATVETEDVKTNVDKDRVQWSLNAAAGAQYDIVPQVGLYVEPGVKYYIDNKSDVENVFKSRPCSFSLQVGVRLNIK